MILCTFIIKNLPNPVNVTYSLLYKIPYNIFNPAIIIRFFLNLFIIYHRHLPAPFSPAIMVCYQRGHNIIRGLLFAIRGLLFLFKKIRTGTAIWVKYFKKKHGSNFSNTPIAAMHYRKRFILPTLWGAYTAPVGQVPVLVQLLYFQAVLGLLARRVLIADRHRG